MIAPATITPQTKFVKTAQKFVTNFYTQIHIIFTFIFPKIHLTLPKPTFSSQMAKKAGAVSNA